MDRGLDTTFLVEVDVFEHPGHAAARAKFEELLDAGDRLALAPQVLAEFVHVVTDPRRFTRPLSMEDAVARSEEWWQAEEIRQVYPNQDTVERFHCWFRDHSLGRKRLLDTLLATTFATNGVTSVVSSNYRDFAVFGCFDVVSP